MSKYVRVNDNEYKVTVNSGGTITLDTGNESGTVIVTGDLTVIGNTTTVESETVVVRDNVIVLNNGEAGSNGITLVTSGIEIDRNDLYFPRASVLYDESLTWLDPLTNDYNTSGSFVLKYSTGNLAGLRTSSITTNNTDLNLIGIGNTVVSVRGTTNYERQVLPYDPDGVLIGTKPNHDDIIPNIRAIRDLLPVFADKNPPYKLQDSKVLSGDEDDVTIFDSVLEIHDSEADGGFSNLELTLDGVSNAIWYADRHEVQDIKIYGTTIETTASNTDLILTSPGGGSVQVNDNLKLILMEEQPQATETGIKIYANAQSFGGTGINFVNTSNTRDELVSNRRAIIYGMIF